ncbi:MAG: hypothetical protein IPK74_21705 [Deltaproteobacteria bacterium]|nr:hypothetical protein [Deltaproteobacteria bacterium]
MRPTTGDLFAHFGVAVPVAEPSAEAEPASRVAAACPRCGWYVTAVESTCRVCGPSAGEAR